MNGPKNEEPFVFKQFAVKHHLCAHKVGFDGVLLGAWANFEEAQNILDIGTGCGLIALMAAQQNPSAFITGIEMHTPSARQASENFASSKWHQNLKVMESNFLEHDFAQAFDHIVTNPPFYVNRIAASGIERNAARHLTQERLKAFMLKTSQCLAPRGHFSMILPWREWPGFKTILLDAGYWTKRECVVFTRQVHTPERMLVECCLEKCEKTTSALNIYDEAGKYSAEYSKLTRPFYLNI